MNGFDQARTVEAEAMFRLKPFLREHSDGQFVLLDKGPLAPLLQETLGDVLFNHSKMGRLVAVEVKAEEKFTGNFYLETWSNLNAGEPAAWEGRGSNPGWLLKIHPTLLFYYFLAVDRLYIIRAHRLFRWAFCTPSLSGLVGATRIHDFRRAPQRKYSQRNDTHGHLVDVAVIDAEVGFQVVNPRQLALPFPLLDDGEVEDA